MKKLWPLAFALGLSSCAGLQSITNPDPKPVYDLDLSGTIDGVPWDGIAVGSADSQHEINIISKTDVNYFVVETCHRWDKFEDVIKPSSFTHWNGNNNFTWEYDEAPGIEDTGKCVLRLQAFSKQVGAGQAYGLMIFQNKNYTLPAENICNGADGWSHGTSVCKSFVGLKERLRFKEQVIAAAPNADGSLVPGQCVGKFIDATTFEYLMPLGECMIEFASVAAPHKFHVALGFGFNKVQYRGAQ